MSTFALRISMFFVALIAMAARAPAQSLSEPLLTALESLRAGKATPGQRALLFQNNALLNNARLNGWMADGHYQAMQRDFAGLNEGFARLAAKMAGAELTVQTPTSARFSPGTDSDYIAKLTAKNAVGQIEAIQQNYNKLVNAWRQKCLVPEGMAYKPYPNWHRRLDVDFMADPHTVSNEQFKAIKGINNGAYGRREAAEYERITRMKDGPSVGESHIREYALEMQEQIAKKRAQMARFQANPSLLHDRVERGKLQQLMAMEQKYVERLESVATRIRNQERLRYPEPFRRPEIKVSLKDGVFAFEQRSTSAAARGAIRAPGSFNSSAVGSALTRNSAARAIQDLADAMAEAHAQNPRAWPNAAKTIAAISSELSPAEKGQLIERMIRKESRGGKTMAREVAIEMRRPVAASPSGFQKLDGALRKAFGVTENLSEMGETRQKLNLAAHRALSGLDKLGKVGVALEVLNAAKEGREYAFQIAKAIDRTTTDAEATEAFKQAQAAAYRLAKSGGMGALFLKVPTLGAMYGAARLGHDGARWLLENTETGQFIDRSVAECFDRGLERSTATYDQVLAYFGGQSSGMVLAAQPTKLEASYLQGIKEGRIKLAAGYTSVQLISAVRAGDKALVNRMLAKATPAARPTDNQGYMAWVNDVGWIHVGTVESFRARSERRSEIWGGMSSEPQVKSPLLGGRTFDKIDDAMSALAGQIGGSIVKRFSSLASPWQYYDAGDKHVGFEIVRHPAFKSAVESADRRAASRG